MQTARVNLGYTDIRAPIDARAGAILVNLGNLVKANDTNPLITLNEVMPIYVQFSVPEAQLPAVRGKGVGRLEIRAYRPNDPNPSVGKLTFIDNAVDATTAAEPVMAAGAQASDVNRMEGDRLTANPAEEPLSEALRVAVPAAVMAAAVTVGFAFLAAQWHVASQSAELGRKLQEMEPAAAELFALRVRSSNAGHPGQFDTAFAPDRERAGDGRWPRN